MTFNFKSNISFCALAAVCLLALTSAVDATKCITPLVRREWRSLSRVEQKEFMDAVKCLSTLPHDPALTPITPANISQIPPINPNSSAYDDFTYIHMDLNPIIHFTAMFFPWHRLYLNAMETALREKCHYPGAHPYWDWTKDAADFEHSDMFNPDPEVGFGGWGDPENDLQISTGALADLIRPYPSPHHIRRNFTLRPFEAFGSPFPDNQSFSDPMTMVNTTFTKSNIDYIIGGFVGDFFNLQAYVEGPPGPHGAIHQIISADMIGDCPNGTGPPDCIWGAKWTPNDPFFFLHHGMIDKMWWQWQNAHPANFYSFTGGSVPTFGIAAPVTYKTYSEFPNGLPPMLNFSTVLPGDGIFEDRTVYDVLEIQGDTLCYTYE